MRVIKIGHELGDVEVLEVPSILSFKHIIGEGWETSTFPQELFDNDIALFCAKNGLFKGLEPNYNLYPFFYVGTCLMTHYDGFRYSSLTDTNLIFIKQWLKSLDNGELYEVNI